MGKKILITGGTGTVGRFLSKLLTDRGHEVALLSRSTNSELPYKIYSWEVKHQTIDPKCIDGVDTIIHLAGAGIADQRWTDHRKKILVNSRTDSIELIYKLLNERSHVVRNVVSASAAGFYSDRGNQILTESDPPAHDFLGECCIAWEKAVDKGVAMGLRVVKFRTGVILDKNSGALEKLAQPIKYGFGAALGDGKQWVPWIHPQDVANMYIFGVEEPLLNGAYNMCSPHPLTNQSLTKAIAKQLKKRLWLPNVPAFALQLALGEMSAVVLGSTRMDVGKIEDAGFKFSYPDITSALQNIYE